MRAKKIPVKDLLLVTVVSNQWERKEEIDKWFGAECPEYDLLL